MTQHDFFSLFLFRYRESESAEKEISSTPKSKFGFLKPPSYPTKETSNTVIICTIFISTDWRPLNTLTFTHITGVDTSTVQLISFFKLITTCLICIFIFALYRYFNCHNLQLFIHSFICTALSWAGSLSQECWVFPRAGNTPWIGSQSQISDHYAPTHSYVPRAN